MVAIIGKYNKTLEMKRQGIDFHCNYFPEHARVYDELHNRRRTGKAIDGRCFKDAGEQLKEMKQKRIR